MPQVTAPQIFALARKHCDITDDEDDESQALYIFDRQALRDFCLDLFRLVSDRVEVIEDGGRGGLRTSQGG
jgi:hypothetical protein